MNQSNLLCAAVAAAVAAGTLAAQNTYPLPASAASGSTNAFENTAPFLAPRRVVQTLVVNRNTLNLQGLPSTFGLWDMSAFDPTGRYVFTPSEAVSACGIFRYDTQTQQMAVLMAGQNALPRNPNPVGWNPLSDNYSRFDPCTFSPFGTVLSGEETTGGRLFEVTNPLAAPPFNVRWLTQVPAISHEGTRFDSQGNMYVVDEDNSGCIYKYVPTVPGDLGAGQTFVLSVDGYAADPGAAPNETWNSTANRLTNRFGPATWVPMTNAAGVPLTATNPFVYVTANSGRIAADELVGTPYGRPEDMDIGLLQNGNDVLYVTVTSENRVLSIELTGTNTAHVRVFCDFNTINLATGADVNPLQNDPFTSPGGGTVFSAPDNLAVDAFGSVYVIEDGEPNGGDVWKCVDIDKDGVAEAMGLFLSLGITGSEPSGMVFHPTNPYRFIINVQHPASGNDATWAFDTNPYRGSNQVANAQLLTGVNSFGPSSGPGEYVKTVSGGQNAIVRVVSPNGSLELRPFAMLIQGFSTAAGQPPFLPPLWINPLFSGSILLAGGVVGPFTPALPAGGSVVVVGVPPCLLGFSVMVQGFIVAQDGSLVMTDGHEYILN